MIFRIFFLILASIFIGCKNHDIHDKIFGIYKDIKFKKNGNIENIFPLSNQDKPRYLSTTFTDKKLKYFLLVLYLDESYEKYPVNEIFFMQFSDNEKEVFINFPRVDTTQTYLPFRGNWKVKKLTKYRLELEADSAGTKWELIMDQRPPK